jgi:hypothetical protein
MSEIIFAKGFSFKRNENAPDFVVGKVSISVSDAVEFLGIHEKNGWVNLDIKQSKMGAYYMSLDNFVPNSQRNQQANEEADDEVVVEEEATVETSEEVADDGDGLPF